jgi:hypothetical protein
MMSNAGAKKRTSAREKVTSTFSAGNSYLFTVGRRNVPILRHFREFGWARLSLRHIGGRGGWISRRVVRGV